MAAGIVPEIEAAPGAIQGEILTVHEDKIASEIQLNDLVMCRTTAPLIKLAYELIGMGKPARVKGRDIGAGLVAMVDKIRRFTKCKDFANFNLAIDDYMSAQAAKINDDEALMRLRDKIESLTAVIGCVNADSFESLKIGIESIFTDGTPGITLATVHRCKGLEADRTIILHPELMPHPTAKTPEAKVQEENVRYIAYTRAKQVMILVDHPKKDKKG